MTISDRYRDITREVQTFVAGLGDGEAGAENRRFREAAKAVAALEELRDGVGDIPRIKLESKLTPVLLKAHQKLDQARLLFEEAVGLKARIRRLTDGGPGTASGANFVKDEIDCLARFEKRLDTLSN